MLGWVCGGWVGSGCGCVGYGCVWVWVSLLINFIFWKFLGQGTPGPRDPQMNKNSKKSFKNIIYVYIHLFWFFVGFSGPGNPGPEGSTDFAKLKEFKKSQKIEKFQSSEKYRKRFNIWKKKEIFRKNENMSKKVKNVEKKKSKNVKRSQKCQKNWKHWKICIFEKKNTPRRISPRHSLLSRKKKRVNENPRPPKKVNHLSLSKM